MIRSLMALIDFMPVVSFYTPWKHQKSEQINKWNKWQKYSKYIATISANNKPEYGVLSCPRIAVFSKVIESEEWRPY